MALFMSAIAVTTSDANFIALEMLRPNLSTYQQPKKKIHGRLAGAALPAQNRQYVQNSQRLQRLFNEFALRDPLDYHKACSFYGPDMAA